MNNNKTKSSTRNVYVNSQFMNPVDFSNDTPKLALVNHSFFYTQRCDIKFRIDVQDSPLQLVRSKTIKEFNFLFSTENEDRLKKKRKFGWSTNFSKYKRVSANYAFKAKKEKRKLVIKFETKRIRNSGEAYAFILGTWSIFFLNSKTSERNLPSKEIRYVLEKTNTFT